MSTIEIRMGTNRNGGTPVFLTDALAHLRQRSESLHIKEVGHARLSGRLDRYGRLIGLAVVILTTVAGTTVFAELGKNTGTAAKITVGVITAVAAVLAAVKEHAAFGKSSATHLEAAAKYGAIHHHIEEKILDYECEAPSEAALDKELEQLNRDESELNRTAIVLGGRAYDWAKRWVEDENKAHS